MIVQEALDQAVATFEARKIESPRLSAELIVAHLVGTDREGVLTHSDRQMSNTEESQLQALIQRRCKNEPVPYITGKTEFYSVPLQITSGVFIPRPETETLVDVAIDILNEMDHVPKIYEMCIGSGAITLGIASKLEDGEFWGSDISNTAIQVAQQNVRDQGLENYVTLREGNMFVPLRTELSKDFDMFVCNPPYIKTNDIPKLESQIKDYEPHLALDGGRDGMQHIKSILDGVAPILRSGGYILLEAEPGLMSVIRTEVRRRAQFEGLKIHKDASGKDRVVEFRTR